MVGSSNPFEIYAKILDQILEIPDNYLSVADVAELADAQASGACALRGVEVRLLSSAVNSHVALRVAHPTYLPQYARPNTKQNRPSWPNICELTIYLTKIVSKGR